MFINQSVANSIISNSICINFLLSKTKQKIVPTILLFITQETSTISHLGFAQRHLSLKNRSLLCTIM